MDPFQIVINVDSNGQINVTGPIEEKALCIGVIEIAKDVIIRFKPPVITPASENDIHRISKNGANRS